MEHFTCPTCRAERPDEYHLDWCTYAGPDFSDIDDSDELTC